MAVIKNHFETTLSDDITLTTHTITGLTAEGSSTNVTNFCQDGTIYFLKSIYKSLTDAGYTDATINEEDYSITVLGFKFFVISISGNTPPNLRLFPYIYVPGSASRLDSSASNNNYLLNEFDKTTLSYNIIIRGDENCVQISYSSFSYPNSEVPLIFIAKAKNLITDKEAFCYFYIFEKANSAQYIYFRDKDKLYNTVYNNIYSDMLYFPAFYGRTGNNTQSKFVCEPVLGNYGTYLIYSLLKCNSVNFEKGKYYKIGNDLYFCHGYKLGSSASYDGSYLLFKVS